MAKITKEQLIFVAEELNELMGLSPAIDVSKSEKIILKKLTKASALLAPDDELTNKATKILRELGLIALDLSGDEEPKKKSGKKADKKADKKAAKKSDKKADKKAAKKSDKKSDKKPALSRMIDSWINDDLGLKKVAAKAKKECEARGVSTYLTVDSVKNVVKYRIKTKGKDFYEVDVDEYLK